MLRVVRLGLGYFILFLNAVFRPKRVKRSVEQQERVDHETRALALYQFYLCPFCVRVRRMIDRLNLNIEYRDAKSDERHRHDLMAGGGRIKVPCLRIEEKGDVRWMYESKAINAYLLQRWGVQD